MDSGKSNIRKEIRKTLEKENGRSLAEEEVDQVERFLKTLVEITVDQVLTEAEWLHKLEQHPGGFELDGAGRTCPTCHTAMGKRACWYDKRGLKCKACQQALDKRIIPASLMTKPDSYYTEIELELKFDLKRPVLNAWIKKGIIKPRVIPALDKGTHVRLFLRNENRGFLPPKKLLQGGCHIEERDGQPEYVFGPW